MSRVETPARIFGGRTLTPVLSRREEAMATPGIDVGIGTAVDIERDDRRHPRDRSPESMHDLMRAQNERVG